MSNQLKTSEERFPNGKALREKVPREKHAEFASYKARDPAAIPAESEPLRVQSLLPVRYDRMLQSPFTFLRGAGHLPTLASAQ